MLRTIRRVLAEIGHSQNQIRPLTKSPVRGSSPDGAKAGVRKQAVSFGRSQVQNRPVSDN